MTPLRWLLTAISFAAAIGAAAYVVAQSWPAGAGAGALALPLGAHALALAAALLEIGARGVKLALSARALRVPLTLRTAVRTCLGGDFGAAVTPARSGSEPARFLILAESGTPAAGAVIVLFAELVLEMLSLVIVAGALVALFPGTAGAVRGLAGLVGGYAAFVLGAGAVGVTLARRHGHGPPPRWVAAFGVRGGRWRSVQRALRQLRTSAWAVRAARKGTMLLALLASVAHVVARLLVLPVLVLSVAPGAPLAPLAVWPLALQYGAAVAPAPGGGGFVEVAFRTVLGPAIPAFALGAALVWWRVYTFYLYVPLGALAAGRTVMRALRARGAAAEAEPAPLRRSA